MSESDLRKIFIFEPDERALERATLAVRQAGFEVVIARTSEEATAELEAESFAAMLIAEGDSGFEIGQYIKEFTSVTGPMAAMVSQSAEDPRGVADRMGAEAFLRRPLTRNCVELFADLGRRVIAQFNPHTGEFSRQQSGAFELPKTRNLFHGFDEAKDFLLLEVRRAKRYAYPLSVLLVRLDPIPAIQQLHRPSLPRAITSGLAVAIAKSIRVIDLPVHYADDSILIFLSHTELSGAVEVGRRIKRRIKRITYRDQDLTCQVTASVGVAGFSVGDRVTFSKLVKDATAALRAAQLKGGDRVMRRSDGSGKGSALKAMVERTQSTVPEVRGQADSALASAETELVPAESEPASAETELGEADKKTPAADIQSTEEGADLASSDVGRATAESINVDSHTLDET